MRIKKSFLLLYIGIIILLILVVMNRCFNTEPNPNSIVTQEVSGDHVDKPKIEKVEPATANFICSNYKNWDAVKDEAKNLVEKFKSSLEIVANPKDYTFARRQQHRDLALSFFANPDLTTIEMITKPTIGTKKEYSVKLYLDFRLNWKRKIEKIEWKEIKINDFDPMDEDTYKSNSNFTQIVAKHKMDDLGYWIEKSYYDDITKKKVEIIFKVPIVGDSCTLKLGNITAVNVLSFGSF